MGNRRATHWKLLYNEQLDFKIFVSLLCAKFTLTVQQIPAWCWFPLRMKQEDFVLQAVWWKGVCWTRLTLLMPMDRSQYTSTMSVNRQRARERESNSR